jgi:hypothetical protein
MRVIEIKDVEDCFDGSFIKELLFDREITKELVFHLGRLGDIQYFDTFARPFFKIRVKSKYDLKGIVGNRTLRIHLKSPSSDSIRRFCEENGLESAELAEVP